MARKGITEEIYLKIYNDYKSGFSLLELSEKYGYKKETISRHLRKNGAYIPIASKKFTDEEKEIFEKYGKSAANTGSAESQIALFTFRIAHLTEHLKANHKDYSTERALKMLVGKRRRLLDYLIKVDIERYRAIIKELGIRK